MSNKIDNEKTCKNCRYYSQHYSKQGIRYGIVHCGHCLNGNHNNRIKKSLFEACEYWNDVAVKKEERKKSIKETLEFMSEQLQEMTMLLKDDKGEE